MKLPESVFREVQELFGTQLYDCETEDSILNFLYARFPGPTWAVYADENECMHIDASFKDDKEFTLFLIKHS